jgi:hypothetical protein
MLGKDGLAKQYPTVIWNYIGLFVGFSQSDLIQCTTSKQFQRMFLHWMKHTFISIDAKWHKYGFFDFLIRHQHVIHKLSGMSSTSVYLNGIQPKLSFPQLTHLDLSYTCTKFMTKKQLPNLKHLKLDHCVVTNNISDFDLISLWIEEESPTTNMVMLHLPNLRFLHLKHFAYRNFGIKYCPLLIYTQFGCTGIPPEIDRKLLPNLEMELDNDHLQEKWDQKLTEWDRINI